MLLVGLEYDEVLQGCPSLFAQRWVQMVDVSLPALLGIPARQMITDGLPIFAPKLKKQLHQLPVLILRPTTLDCVGFGTTTHKVAGFVVIDVSDNFVVKRQR